MLLKNLKPSSLPEWKRLDKSREDSDKRTTANLEAKVKAQAPNLHRSLWLQECLHPLIMPHNSSPRQTPGFSSLSRMACLGHTRRWEQPPPMVATQPALLPTSVSIPLERRPALCRGILFSFLCFPCYCFCSGESMQGRTGADKTNFSSLDGQGCRAGREMPMGWELAGLRAR